MHQNKVVVKNAIYQAGYLSDLRFYGNDDDIQLLIDKINEFDARYTLSLYIKSSISLTGDKVQKLFEVLKNRTLDMFWIQIDLNKEETRVVLDFLSSPDSNYSKYFMKMESEDVAEALSAIQNKFSFIALV